MRNILLSLLWSAAVVWLNEFRPKCVIRVKDEYVLQTGFTPDTKRSYYYSEDETGAEWVTIADMIDGSITSETKSRIADKYFKEHYQPVTPKGSLLYSFKLSVGKTAITDRDIFTNEAIASFLPGTDRCLDFLKFASSLIIHNANENIYGAKILNQDLIYAAPITYPPLPEQHRIADFLDDKCSKIDDISKKIQEEIETLEEYKKSVITEAVTKGLDPNVELKDSGIEWIGEIPVSWIVLRLKNVCSGFSNGTSITQLTSDISEYPVSRIETISSGAINYDKVGYVAKCNSNYKLNKNDILVSNINSIQYLGNCAMYEGEKPLYHGMNLLRIVPQTINPKYLHYYMKSRCFKTIMQILCKPAINQASVSASNLKNVFIPIPSQKEQNAIVNCLDKKLDSISRLLEAKQTQLSTLEEYKKSLIYEYVTGKREVA